VVLTWTATEKGAVWTMRYSRCRLPSTRPSTSCSSNDMQQPANPSQCDTQGLYHNHVAECMLQACHTRTTWAAP
jgi:hypothetical protein